MVVFGEENLTPRRRCCYASGPVDIDPEVVTTSQDRFSGVQAHADAQWPAVGPAVGGEAALGDDGSAHRISGSQKGGEERISLRSNLRAAGPGD